MFFMFQIDSVYTELDNIYNNTEIEISSNNVTTYKWISEFSEIFYFDAKLLIEAFPSD